MVNRNNKLRICIDPVDLNKALKRVDYQMPTVEEILPELKNAKVFTTVDASKGFWQMPLQYDSSLLTTFWTPYGRYRWKRVPFGVKTAPEPFKKLQHEVIEGLEGVECICDDILVYGCGETFDEAMCEHNQKLKKLLLFAQQRNVKLNKSKLKLCQSQVRFFGHVLTDGGLKADPIKVAAIVDMPHPRNASEGQTFLGMVTYLSKFLPNLSTVAEPIRKVSVNGAEFRWGQEQSKSFDDIRQLVLSAPILQYYDVSKPLVLQCDASSTGLGAVLLQDGKPVSFASRALSRTEHNYAQIEKETLAVLFGCIRFSQFIVGREIVVQSDHKPLQVIFKNPLLSAPKRLQRMLLALQRYSIRLEYVPGSKIYLADLLSRLHLSDDKGEKIHDIYSIRSERRFAREIERINMVESVPVSDERIRDLVKATAEDEEMQILSDLIINGFPENTKMLKNEIKKFHKYATELSTQNGLLFKGHRIIVPNKLRKDMLRRLHRSHSGIEKTQKLARDSLFWPGLSEQIREEVERCRACKQNSANLPNEPMLSTNIPRLPFEIVSMDVFELNLPDGNYAGKRRFLLTVDHYSDFFEVDEVADLRADTIVQVCKRNFARHGIPKLVISDNGTHFKNAEFSKFAAAWEFKFSTTSPYHALSNGKAEVTVKIAKALIKKSIDNGDDIYLSLLSWRNTPNKMDSSPVQRLFSRRTRCPVPFTNVQLQPQLQIGVGEKIVTNKERAKFQFDRTTRKCRQLEIGEPVFVKLRGVESPWTSGRVHGQYSNRSYVIEHNDKLYRRNRVHIMPQLPSNLVVTSHISFIHIGRRVCEW